MSKSDVLNKSYALPPKGGHTSVNNNNTHSG